MKSLAKQLLLLTYCVLSTLVSQKMQAQEAIEPKWYEALNISGSVDAYFRTNLNNTNSAEDEGATLNPGTSFANLPGFSLGMANLVLGYEKDKTGFVADFVFGPRGEDAVFLAENTGSRKIINQLYAYWNVSESVKLTLGNFNTFVGYEVISPTGNYNYSTSYLFSYGPFSHTGIKADIDLGGGFSGMIGIMDPTDFTDFNPFNKYFLGTQLGYEFGSGGAYLNGLFGEDFTEIDLTASTNLTEKTLLGINAAYVDAQSVADDIVTEAGFWGTALYLSHDLSKSFSLGARGEYSTDKGVGFAGGIDENVFALTLSGNYKVSGLTIIPEIRMDTYSTPLVVDSDLSTKDNLVSFLVAAVYSF